MFARVVTMSRMEIFEQEKHKILSKPALSLLTMNGDSARSTNWMSVASSADGTKLVAAAEKWDSS